MSVTISLDQVGLCYPQYQSPRDAFLELLFRKKRHTDFYALNNISLSLQQGESLGVIGDNGAGKSTLLKLLAGNLNATSGKLECNGTRSAILELGSGFHPDFTGWENARLGLRLQGVQSSEIDNYLQQVAEFSELGDFMDRPIKTYSSGMVVRLAFSVAVVIQPEILIVDEALSVGDQHFQKKSLDKMRSILANQATLIFCSHNLYQIKEMCTQAIWLEKGEMRMLGQVDDVVDAYQDVLRGVDHTVNEQAHAFKTDQAYIKDIVLEGGLQDQGSTVFNTGDYFSIRTEIDLAGCDLADVHLGLVIRRNDDIQCYGISTLHENISLQTLENGEKGIRFVMDQLPLLSGSYCLEAWLIDSSGVHIYDSRERCCHFSVRQESQHQGVGVAIMAHHWEGKHAIRSAA